MTIKVHRHNIMNKMSAKTLPDLVRMMERLNPSAADAEAVGARLSAARRRRHPAHSRNCSRANCLNSSTAGDSLRLARLTSA